MGFDKAMPQDSSFILFKLLFPEKDVILNEHFMNVAMGIDHVRLTVAWDFSREKDANCMQIVILDFTETQH